MKIMTEAYHIISEILSHNLNEIENLVMWPKVGNSRISVKEVIINSM